MKSNKRKQLGKSVVSFALVLSLVGGLGMTQTKAYAMDEEETPAESVSVEVAAPVESVIENAAPAESVEEAAPAEEAAEAEAAEEAAPAESVEEAAPAEEAEEAAPAEETEEAAPAVTETYYNNEKGNIVLEVLDNGTLKCSVNPDAAVDTDEDLAIVQLFQENNLVTTGMKAGLQNSITKIVLGEGIKGVGWEGYTFSGDKDRDKTDVFFGFSALTEVVASASLEVIGWSAFRKCTSLTSFNFDACTNLRTIMQQAFSETALESVALPENIQTVDDMAFEKVSTIQSIDYNAKDYDHSVSAGKDVDYFSSKTFAASQANGYDLTVGSEVESLPQGFFKAFQGMESLRFAGAEDTDDQVVEGRALTVEAAASFNSKNVPEPFRKLAEKNEAACVVDESGVVYQRSGEDLSLLYFTPGMSQYVLPESIRVSDSAAAVSDSFSRYIQNQITARVNHSIELDGVNAEGAIPSLKNSGTVLVLNDEGKFQAFTAEALTGATFTALETDENGETVRYTYTFNGWQTRDGEAAPETLGKGETLDLVAAWTKTLYVEPKAEEPKAVTRAAAPAVYAAPAAAAAAEEMSENAVPMSAPKSAQSAEEIGAAAVPLAAAHSVEAQSASHSAAWMAIPALLALSFLFFLLIAKRRDEDEEDA